MREFLTSRSRVQTFQRCARARWWMDEARGGGFEPVSLAVPLVTGGSVHVGLRTLMLACTSPVDPAEFMSNWWARTIEAAVADALGDYDSRCAGRGFQLEELESQSFVYAEQRALTEALVRLAGMRVVPRLLEVYEVLEVERMDVASLVADDSSHWQVKQEWQCPDCGYHHDEFDWIPRIGGDGAICAGCSREYPEARLSPRKPDWEVLWRSIPDALMRSRADGDLYILSWKTTAEFDSRRDQDARTDMQGLSEAWALESRLEQWRQDALNMPVVKTRPDGLVERQKPEHVPGWFIDYLVELGPIQREGIRIRGVQMVYLVKGQRRRASGALNESLGTEASPVVAYKTASPLIYGYARVNSVGPADLAFASDWTCARAHPMRKSQWYPTGECPGDGRKHKRGDEWKSFQAWESIGVKAWIEALATGAITPEAGDALDAQWAMPVPHFRTRESVERWLRQTRASEARIAKALVRIKSAEASGAEVGDLLDESFPQTTERCGDWFHRRCPMWEICHGPGHVAEDPVGSGMFREKTQYAPMPPLNGIAGGSDIDTSKYEWLGIKRK